ncbi:DUF3093 domain-containing protein [Solicola gregarius]|uniref:DUF3093 domain-containing protein n=1 Tax=Solicola gregarius TaxID=2908642 RepID=A0AA46TH49_9ACTN|nr:DUF3093 domain-containing protein [Solicola gregarius]UYM05259.1 DUF3093 domain-containing protein [Solicola gregarius]
MPGSPTDGEYAESLYAPPSWWLLSAGFAIIVWWVFVLATPMAFAVGAGAVVAIALGIALWAYGREGVEVHAGEVLACGARIEVAYCGDAVALDAERTAAVRGRDADARAYLAIRPYVATAVRLDIVDARDPTPYWLISSRDPARLVAAIDAARTPSGTTGE